MSGVLLPIHIVAGGLAIILGTIALVVKKGGVVHRRGGMLFVIAMTVMGATASLLGKNMGGWMSIYLVLTAVTTMRPPSAWTRRLNIAGLTIAIVLAILSVVAGVAALNVPGRSLDGAPFAAFFLAGFVWSLAAIGDVRVMRFGMPRGGKRLARHLWRMCFALFVAAASFFSIRERVARVLPEPFTSGPMRALPIVLLLGTMVYWLWRVRRPRPVTA